MRLPAPPAPAVQGALRRVGGLLAEPRFRVALLAGVVSFGVMSFVMTAAPISMHVHHWWALVLLGAGWNVLFVAGTTGRKAAGAAA